MVAGNTGLGEVGGKHSDVHGGFGGSGALGCLGQSFGRTPDRNDVALIEIADLDAIVERDTVALPVEAVGQNDLARHPCGNAGVEIDGGLDPVADLQVELAGMRVGQSVRLPIGHGNSLPDERVDR